MTADYEKIDDVAIVTLNRPDRFNAIDGGLSRAVVGHLGRAGREARAVVLTGSGRAFCSGADLTELVDEYDRGGPSLGSHLDDVFHPMVHALSNCAVPVVGAVNGVAAGAGMGIALGCDIRVMAKSAYLTSAFTAIGLTPDSGSTWLLPHHVGLSVAMDMALTNRRMSADETLARGLCVEVVADEELVERSIEHARKLADLVPDSLVTTRRLLRGSARLTFEQALEAERAAQDRLGKTPEHAEGVRAFLEKRAPDFRNPLK